MTLASESSGCRHPYRRDIITCAINDPDDGNVLNRDMTAVLDELPIYMLK
jgi:hypothetical protein